MFDRLRLAPGRAKLLLLFIPPVLAAAGVAAALLYAPRPTPTTPAQQAPGAFPQQGQAQAPDQVANLPVTGGLLVEVSGAVAHPGLYRLQKGQRVDAAIAAAGGLAAQADPTHLPNMAKRLTDGMQVNVPGFGTPATTGSSSRTAKIDLNAATADELANVPGFTADLAAEAVRYRQDYGGFTNTKQLVDVLGMSQADYSVARRYLRV
jgi:competence protein ComEA